MSRAVGACMTNAAAATIAQQSLPSLAGRLFAFAILAVSTGCSAQLSEDGPESASSQEALGGLRSVDNILYAGVPGVTTFASRIENAGDFCIKGYGVVSDTGRSLSPAYRFEIEPHKVSGEAGSPRGYLEVSASIGASITATIPGLGPLPERAFGFSTDFTRTVGQSADPGQYAHVMFTIMTRDIEVALYVWPVTTWNGIRNGCDDKAATWKRVVLRVPAEVASESYASTLHDSKYADTPMMQSLDPWQWMQSAEAFGVSYKFGR
jgi:hypothetical protein